ncbi:MAG: hypothetical protein EBQ59_01990 [Verrucomicrobia bacterium]|nr:hypothetical protein [Verrucomicrobiota bacterium]
MHADRIAGTADGLGITLSDIRRQIEPIIGQIHASVHSDSEFEKALESAADETLRSMTERQLVIADFRAGTGKLPAMYIDADIEETIRRDFSGDRNRFVASLRSVGTTPLAYRKFIEDRIIYDYMVSQIRRTATEVSPGKIQAYYEAHRSSFERKEQIQVRQITLTQGAAETLAEAKVRADTWAEALRHPEKINDAVAKFKLTGTKMSATPTFAEIAERISTDDYAKKGGDAGWHNCDELNERVNDAQSHERQRHFRPCNLTFLEASPSGLSSAAKVIGLKASPPSPTLKCWPKSKTKSGPKA